MKHFSALVHQSAVLSVDTDMTFTDTEFIHCQLALIIAMDANPDDMSSSEERVLSDFIIWFKECKEDESLRGSYPWKPVFVYTNINKGFTQVIICTDVKGKLRLYPY